MNKKKILSASLLITCLALTLPGCSKDKDKEKELGTFEDVIVSETEDLSEENVFKAVDEPLGYQYKKIKHPRAYMSFSVPSDWDVDFPNARAVKITAPEDDLMLPDLTLYLISSYSMDGSYHDTVGSYGKVFETDLSELYFPIEGRSIRRTGQTSPDSISSDTDITDRGDLLSLSITDDIAVRDPVSGKIPENPCTAISYYINWAQQPAVFTTICPQEKKESVQKLMQYMVSSITMLPQTSLSAKELTYDNITLAVPSEFAPVSGMENVFLSPSKKSLATSGMGVAVYKAEKELTEESIMFDYGERMSEGFLPKGTYYNMISCFAVDTKKANIDGKDAKVYTASCTVMPKKAESADFYMPGQMWYMTIYALPQDEDGQQCIVIWSQDSQGRYLDAIKKLVEERTKISK